LRTSHEQRRGCGYRKGGGFYLIGGQGWTACGKLPYPLLPCEHCGQGLKFHRGFGWFNPRQFINGHCCETPHSYDPNCSGCAMGNGMPERAGIMWVGTKFYTPESFTAESVRMGISKRLPTIPRELLKNIGNVRVYLAHPKACLDAEGKPAPGIFTTFVPQRVEYVVRGNETPEELGKIEQRGVELVKVVPVADQPPLPAVPSSCT
jgi:hypothetical protein